ALAGGGKTGTSTIFEIITGGAGAPPSLPALLEGLQSFSLAPGVLPGAPLPIPATIRPNRQFADGNMEWLLTGRPGATYIIESSSDSKTWKPVLTVHNSTGTLA